MLRPECHGTITLSSTSAFDPPKVDPNYLNSKHDVDVMVYGLKLSLKIALSTGAFVAWDWPANVEEMTDEQLVEHVRETSETLYHPMCTAKMGTSERDSVVDGELKVHGVKGLRVIDASIFPTALACHPCGPVIMLGERMADIIKAGQ